MIDNIRQNTTDVKKFSVYFPNFRYFSQQGPFSSVVDALIAAKQAGFDASIYRRDGSLMATWSALYGTRQWNGNSMVG